MAPTWKRNGLRIAEVWVSCMAAVCVVWGCYVWITAAAGGRGIGIDKAGVFVLQQGLNVLQIPQGFGWFLFLLSTTMWLLLLASIVLGMLTRRRHGTVRIDVLRDESVVRAGLVNLLAYCGGFFVLSLVGYCAMILLR